MRIALLYNQPLPSKYHSLGEGTAVHGVMDSVRAVAEALRSAGHVVQVHALTSPVSSALDAIPLGDGDLVFNLFEGIDGRPETEAMLARELEDRGIPFTGASSNVLACCLDKGQTKDLLTRHGIPTPEYRLLWPHDPLDPDLDFPVIVKPAREDASHGLGPDSVVRRLADLELQVRLVVGRYGGPALVERFLEGREFNAAVLGCPLPQVLPITEIVYTDAMPGPHILTFDAKWSPEHPSYRASLPQCPARTGPDLQCQLEDLARAAHRAVGSPPYARVDLRCDGQGRPYVLEVNPNPDLGPQAGLALQARAGGMSYGEVINTIVELSGGSRAGGEARLRDMAPEDVEELVALTADTGFFRPDEVAVAREVLEEAARRGAASGYQVRVAHSGSRLLGYVCFGPTPLTRGTWDIYWLAVAPDWQRRGIGGRLMRRAEEEIARQGGRLIVLETSSQELYAPTRQFHLALGYRELGRIPDFYDAGDDKVMYGKALDNREHPEAPP
jgi:D-alanine-D-alanine ligase